MNPKKISLLSAVLNGLLVAGKLSIGLLSHSVALVAESLNSIVDVASSVITYVGISAAAKPADKGHPYGHERSESVAGFVVVILLFISGCWILSDAIPNIIHHKSEAEFNIIGVIVMAVSVVVNLVMSRLKLKIGKKFSSISLVADSKNSSVDMVSSIAVLINLFLIRYYPLSDSILAVAIALYIFYESYHLGLETINSLLDSANPALEAKIKRILNGRDIQYSELRTRKAGGTNMAEVTIHFPAELIGAAVSPKIEEIERELIGRIEELKDISISIKPIQFTEELIRPKFGHRHRYRKIYKNS